MRCRDALNRVQEKIVLFPVSMSPLRFADQWATYAPGGLKVRERVATWEGIGCMRGLRHYPPMAEMFLAFDDAVETNALQALITEAKAEVLARPAGSPLRRRNK